MGTRTRDAGEAFRGGPSFLPDLLGVVSAVTFLMPWVRTSNRPVASPPARPNYDQVISADTFDRWSGAAFPGDRGFWRANTR